MSAKPCGCRVVLNDDVGEWSIEYRPGWAFIHCPKHASVDALIAERDALRAALEGVVRVADRKTCEFAAARAALALGERAK